MVEVLQFFCWQEKYASLCILMTSVRLARCSDVAKTLNVPVLSDSINVIDIEVCMVVLLWSFGTFSNMASLEQNISLSLSLSLSLSRVRARARAHTHTCTHFSYNAVRRLTLHL